MGVPSDSLVCSSSPDVIPADAIPTNVPAVFSASTYFSNFSTESFTGGHDTTQGIFLDSPASSTAHLFSPSDDRQNNWNPNPFPNPISMDLTNSYSADGGADVLSYNQTSEKLLPLEETQKSPVLPEDMTKEQQEEVLQNYSTINHENDLKEKTESEVPVNGRSSTESIRQLTDQITQLFDPSEDIQTNSTFLSSLETRNQELAAQLETERRTNQQLQFTLKESVSTLRKRNLLLNICSSLCT